MSIVSNNLWKKKPVEEPYVLPEEASLKQLVEWVLFTPGLFFFSVSTKKSSHRVSEGKAQALLFIGAHPYCGIDTVELLGIFCDVYANGPPAPFAGQNHVEVFFFILPRGYSPKKLYLG